MIQDGRKDEGRKERGKWRKYDRRKDEESGWKRKEG
jgi:hypothetical protein